MKEIMKKIRSILSRNKRGTQKTRAQSMVEFAVLLPILLLLLLIMVEFGFALNTYLSLIDATRQAARIYSNSNPFILTTNPLTGVITKTDDYDFYEPVADSVINTLNTNSYSIQFDPTRDHVIVSVLSISANTATNPDTIVVTRHPDTSPFFSKPTGGISKFYDQIGPDVNASIKSYVTKNGSTPLNSGLLIVEIYYSYEGTLKITSWFNWATFASDSNPLYLYAYTIMPMGSVKPDSTPTP
jgi:Flp pilus assembly protein TadG